MYIESMDSLSSLMSLKRHYKKDSQYVNDLYTLTYDDNHESLYLSSGFISSLHDTINNNQIEDENVSLVYVALTRCFDADFITNLTFFTFSPNICKFNIRKT